ncbi:helix-turn-helix domain-containing protein [Acidisoma silvae]|uniref:Helix-turn-helix transcriptional regulator n=1 Tax=Acidisoma silvae TaxID=2802396 RepID=A0A964E1J8_9PROT|nr:helix-turn-helix transcriptional regulator [Acidisoma silvae]MCB8877848.1 helix-turn-helix transcriptional regulator [Acidisoma silvae]
MRGVNKPEPDGIRQWVGRNVKAAREYAGLTQQELCLGANLSQPYLSQCESAKWNIGVDNLYRIAVATGFTVSNLVDPHFDPASASRTNARARRKD